MRISVASYPLYTWFIEEISVHLFMWEVAWPRTPYIPGVYMGFSLRLTAGPIYRIPPALKTDVLNIGKRSRSTNPSICYIGAFAQYQHKKQTRKTDNHDHVDDI